MDNLPIIKAGLECHQQLDVGKLFCRCPIEEPEHHIHKFTRKLRLTASELEKIDPAALEAFKEIICMNIPLMIIALV